MTNGYGKGILDLDCNSKRNDPVPSYEAASDFAKSGAVKTHHQLILLAVGSVPRTNMQIGFNTGLSQSQVTRRVAELERRGLICRTKDLKHCPFLKRNVTAWVKCDDKEKTT